MTYFRTIHSSWYQVPVLYGWWDLETCGAIDDAALLSGNGHGNGHGRAVGEERLAALERGHRQARALQLLPVVLGRLLHAGEDDRLAAVVDHSAISCPWSWETPGMKRASVRATCSKVLWSSLRTITLHEPPVPVSGPVGAGPRRSSRASGAQDKACAAAVQWLHER